jgi:predicted short-subunit dehydrogenase-like oxidoreductase (DUF2520 family)
MNLVCWKGYPKWREKGCWPFGLQNRKKRNKENNPLNSNPPFLEAAVFFGPELSSFSLPTIKIRLVKTILIGSGQVATVLGRKMLAAGHEILQVISPQQGHAQSLAKELGCKYASTWEEMQDDADVYIAAISDRALNHLKNNRVPSKGLLLHTAGAVSINALRDASKNYGVIYPLQSLRKEITEPVEIPLLVDANTPENLSRVIDLAKTISSFVQFANDDTRLKLHLASVVVNNFSNHLYTLVEKFCSEEKLNFRLLLPLIDETARRMHESSPRFMQTGPAIRGDQDTINHHLALLKDNQTLRQLYEVLTQSIQQFQK